MPMVVVDGCTDRLLINRNLYKITQFIRHTAGREQKQGEKELEAEVQYHSSSRINRHTGQFF